MVVFLPVFFLSGPEGRIFTPLGLSYCIAIFASLLVAFTQTPVLCSLFLTSGRLLDKESATSTALKSVYRVILRPALRHPWWVVGCAVAMLCGTMALIPSLGREFLPRFHEGNFIVAMTALPGTSLDESMRLGQQVQERLLTYPEVVSVVQRVGMGEVGEGGVAGQLQRVRHHPALCRARPRRVDPGHPRRPGPVARRRHQRRPVHRPTAWTRRCPAKLPRSP